MRFALPDLDESDYEVVDFVVDSSSSSDESEYVPNLERRRKSKLGQAIADFLASSDSEDIDSEDEVGGMLDDVVVVPSKVHWREPTKNKGKARSLLPPAPRLQRPSLSLAAGPSWRKWEPSVGELLREEANQYSEWIKSTEAEAWREGHRVAGERRSRLKDIEQRARAELRASQAGRRDAEAEELQRLMEGLAVRHKKEEADTAKQFADREARLWADIDAAIKDAEKRALDEQAQRAARARKEKEEAAAKIAAEEQAALQKKAEAEKLAKEKLSKEAAEKAEADKKNAEAKQQEEEAKAKEEQKKAVAAEGSRGPTEWTKWVGVQRTIKSQIIEKAKAEANLKKSLRPAMRLITRGLGQVVNTQEAIIRVTNDIHGLFVAQLPAPPSASAPTALHTMPLSYGYLLSHTCKAFIKQAENEIAAKADAAFPLARVALGLLLRGHAAFGQMLFARMVKKCPWVVPYYPRRQEGQPREAYEKSTGRASDESTTEYIGRMAGIVTLYFAILQTPLTSVVETSGQRPSREELPVLIVPVLRLPAAWTWMASTLRPQMSALPPTAHLLLVLIDTVGSELLSKYGPKQVDKVLAAMERGIAAGLIKSDSPSALERLRQKIEDYKKGGNLDPPTARIWS